MIGTWAGKRDCLDKGDRRWAFEGAAVGAEAGSFCDNDIARAIRGEISDAVGRAVDETVTRRFAAPPTLNIKPGHPAHRDLVRYVEIMSDEGNQKVEPKHLVATTHWNHPSNADVS